MKTCMNRCSMGMISACVLLFGLAVALTCCETQRFSHEPPAGMGSLIVDNRSGDYVLEYIDGAYIREVSSYDYEISDLDPGVYRVVLDEKDGYRNYYGDVDVLEGQLTIMELSIDYPSWEYIVSIYFD